MINIFSDLEDESNFVNEYQEHCDKIQILIHAEKWYWQQLELIWHETENGRCSD